MKKTSLLLLCVLVIGIISATGAFADKINSTQVFEAAGETVYDPQTIPETVDPHVNIAKYKSSTVTRIVLAGGGVLAVVVVAAMVFSGRKKAGKDN